MAIRLKRLSKRGCAPLLLFCVLACSSAPQIFLQHGSELKETDVEKVLTENPIAAGENIKITTLGQGPSVSHHLVQVRDREKPHIHKFHDGTVVMVKGRGYLILDSRRIDLSVRDIVYIPRGAVHYFVNTASEPSVAFVVFSPPFDGKDMVPVISP